VETTDFAGIVDGSRCVEARYRGPAQYRKWADRRWRAADPRVEIAPLRPVESSVRN